MPILDISFFKKNSVLQKFKKCVNNILNLQNISENLDLIYEYISYEQSKEDKFECTEYFINNEIHSSFSLLKEDTLLIKFFIKVTSILNKKYLILLNKNSKVCLVYSERLVVYNKEADSSYIKYLTDNFYKDKFLRYATLLLFETEKLKFHKQRLVPKIVSCFNETDDPEIFGMYTMFILRKTSKPQFLTNEKSFTIDNQFIKWDNQFIKWEDIKKIQKESLPHFNFKNKSVSFYKSILTLSTIEEINNQVVEEFINILENKVEHVDFLKYLIREYPLLMKKEVLKNEMNREWSVIEVYKTIINKPTQNKSHFDKTFLDKIITLGIRDQEIFSFIFLINKQAFFSRIKEIDTLLRREGKTDFYSKYLPSVKVNNTHCH